MELNETSREVRTCLASDSLVLFVRAGACHGCLTAVRNVSQQLYERAVPNWGCNCMKLREASAELGMPTPSKTRIKIFISAPTMQES